MINDNVSVIRLELDGGEHSETAEPKDGHQFKFDELNIVSGLKSINNDRWIEYDEHAKKYIRITFE